MQRTAFVPLVKIGGQGGRQIYIWERLKNSGVGSGRRATKRLTRSERRFRGVFGAVTTAGNHFRVDGSQKRTRHSDYVAPICVSNVPR